MKLQWLIDTTRQNVKQVRKQRASFVHESQFKGLLIFFPGK